MNDRIFVGDTFTATVNDGRLIHPPLTLAKRHYPALDAACERWNQPQSDPAMTGLLIRIGNMQRLLQGQPKPDRRYVSRFEQGNRYYWRGHCRLEGVQL